MKGIKIQGFVGSSVEIIGFGSGLGFGGAYDCH